MEVDRIRQCLENSLSVYWSNEGYTCSGIGNQLWVTWMRGTLKEHTIGLKGNHDLDLFYPNPSQISHIVDTEGDRYCQRRPSLLSRPGRLVKFVRGEVVKWVLVLDHAFKEPPDVGLATELAIDAVESEGLGAEDVWVVI